MTILQKVSDPKILEGSKQSVKIKNYIVISHLQPFLQIVNIIKVCIRSFLPNTFIGTY